jgi:hypothetical protein
MARRIRVRSRDLLCELYIGRGVHELIEHFPVFDHTCSKRALQTILGLSLRTDPP